MQEFPAMHGERWTPDDEEQLEELIDHNTPLDVIAAKLQRTPSAIKQHAVELGLLIRPRRGISEGARSSAEN